jgi:hypothetical protein
VQSKEDTLVDPGKGDSDFGTRFGTRAIDAEDSKVHRDDTAAATVVHDLSAVP